MNYRKRKRKYFGCVVLLLNINYILCTLNVKNDCKSQITDDKYDLKTISMKLSEQLKKATYIELGITSLQKIYDAYKLSPFNHNDDKAIDNIATTLANKLTKAFDILTNVKTGLETHIHGTTNIRSENYLISQSVFDKDKTDYRDTYLSQLFSNELANATTLGFEQAYFLATSDLSKEYYSKQASKSNVDDIYMWKLYLSLTNTKRKHIIIGIDIGIDLSDQLLNNMRVLAKEVIAMLTENDRVGVIAFGSECYYNDCRVQLVSMTQQNKTDLHQFIDSLVSSFNGSYNHLHIFEQFYKSIQSNFGAENTDTVMLVYLTANSLNSNETAARTVLEFIAKQEKRIHFPVVINTIIVCNCNNDMVSDHYLQDISEKNFRKYDINEEYGIKGINAINGSMQIVNSTVGLGIVIARLFNATNDGLKDVKAGISLPIWRTTTEHLIVSLYMACGGNARARGLLALDIHFGNVAEDITYFSNQPKHTYAYLLNVDGLVLMHPSFPRPVMAYEQPKFVDISYYENSPNFRYIRNLIVSRDDGVEYATNSTMKYVWKRVLDLYIVCIVVVKENVKSQRKIQKQIYPDISSHYNLLYHRLDLLPPPAMCRHLNQMSTLDAGTVYLSASCFQSPYSYVRGSAGLTVQPLTLQSYMAYIKDNTRLLANPGLKDEVRNDVTILSHILNHLMRQHLQGTLYKYIVRRYVATMNGVMQMYPGSILNVEVEPTRRNWFVRAVEHPGKIVLTSPYLDAGGAGYIVTISHTIYKGSDSGEHTQNDDNIVAVMAMDVTFGYIYKLLLETVPYCSKPDTVKCFIIDDRGYLIYHPNLLEPNGKGPVEQQHIIHKESLVANDLLNHKGFIQKILCNHYVDGTIQRYYKFNTLVNSVLSNVVHGEGCIKYYISAIPNTNAFIGIVNVTCNDVATFCPCSTVDRLCLICNRVEQNECECPCECPLNISETNSNPICAAMAETRPYTSSSNMYNYPYGAGGTTSTSVTVLSTGKPCIPFVCEIHTTYDACLGVLGCEWCRIDVDAETQLTNPFCTQLTSCFHGILGSVNPYLRHKFDSRRDESSHLESLSSESNSNDLLFTSTYSSVGPAAGSIVALCFLLALVFYCYRQYSIQLLERRLYPASCNQQMQMQMQMATIDFNVAPDDDTDTNHAEQLLNGSDVVPIISPYCITTEYRKPPVTGVDSDLGYSTMTPHDESERLSLSFALIELDSQIDDDLNASDSISTNTNTSVFGYPLKSDCKYLTDSGPAQTHCILAPVTVHRDMETI